MLFPFGQLQGNYLYFEIMDLREKMISVTKKLKEHEGMQMIYFISIGNDCFYWIIKGELDMELAIF